MANRRTGSGIRKHTISLVYQFSFPLFYSRLLCLPLLREEIYSQTPPFIFTCPSTSSLLPLLLMQLTTNTEIQRQQFVTLEYHGLGPGMVITPATDISLVVEYNSDEQPELADSADVSINPELYQVLLLLSHYSDFSPKLSKLDMHIVKRQFSDVSKYTYPPLSVSHSATC